VLSGRPGGGGTPERAPRDDGEVFDEYAASYDAALAEGLAVTGDGREFYAAERVRWVARRLGELGSRPHRILDFGCGTGTAVPLLLDAFPGATVRGVDPSARSLAVAREAVPSPRAKFSTVADFAPTGDVDLAFCNGVFHHIPPAGRDAAVALIRAALRPGGLFAFWENNPWNPGTRYVMSRIPFDRDAETLSPPQARAMLRRDGLQPLTTDFRFFFPRFLRVLRPLEDVALTRVPLGGQYLVLCRRG